jgi:cell shape-determining protein MreC
MLTPNYFTPKPRPSLVGSTPIPLIKTKITSMKKIIVSTFLLLFSFASLTVSAMDKKTLNDNLSAMTNEQKEARYNQMKQRVEEIKNLDRSTLTREEKRELKAELKDMNREAKAAGKSGIYISTAGIIIIVLLLIILL